MKPFKLASREYKNEDTLVQVQGPRGSVMIGEGYCTIIAGPCAVESRADYMQLARFLAENGAHILRGGLFKPRTSPYSFKGLGSEGIEVLREARELTGLPIVSEIMDVRDMDLLYQDVDIFQVGSRNMQNYSLLQEMGGVDKPILLKRGLSATIEEWLLAAEYILSEGNPRVILCERGIRTFEQYTRNTVDIGAVPLIKNLAHLPIIVDPSHATGKWKMVTPVAKAAVAAGADGIMVEVHQDPDHALSDGKQSLTQENFALLYQQVKALSQLERKIM
ncbi:MAG TPA: 3-deoxy-7-phosphoheptulonate synthase [Syntrophomonadaceae bacterium]|nr:3-deoxy-7-phosphoheptulonate synthase [Syntrophomonadaceae bacterium]